MCFLLHASWVMYWCLICRVVRGIFNLNSTVNTLSLCVGIVTVTQCKDWPEAGYT